MNGFIVQSDTNYNHILCIYLPILHLKLEELGLLGKNIPLYYDGKFIDIVKKYSNNVYPVKDAPAGTPIAHYDSLNHNINLKNDIKKIIKSKIIPLDLVEGIIKVKSYLTKDIEDYEPSQVTIINRKVNRCFTNISEIKNTLNFYKLPVVDIDFASLSFDDQVRTSKKTKVMFGMHGAGMTNLIFMEKGTTIIDYNPFKDIWNCYEYLAKLFGLNYIIVRPNYSDDIHQKHFKIDIKNLNDKIKYNEKCNLVNWFIRFWKNNRC